MRAIFLGSLLAIWFVIIFGALLVVPTILAVALWGAVGLLIIPFSISAAVVLLHWFIEVGGPWIEAWIEGKK